MSQATPTGETPPAPVARPNGNTGLHITRTELVWLDKNQPASLAEAAAPPRKNPALL